MLELSGDVNFAQESARLDLIGDVGAKDLDRDLPAVLEVRGEKDDAHPTATELALHAVPVPHSRAEAPRESVGHRSNMRAE